MSRLNSFAMEPVAPNSAVVTACFSISAMTDPGIMPRVVEIFAKRGLVPTHWDSRVMGREAEELNIDLQMAGLTMALGEQIAQTMRQIYGVERVLMSIKQPSTAC